MTTSLKHRIVTICTFAIGAAAFVGLLSGNAYATQEHSDPEGLYSHQIAHIFFMVSMIVLAVQIFRTKGRKPGWRYIGAATILFLLWNIDTFTVHIVREHLERGIFTNTGGIWATRIDLSTPEARIFYLGKIFDHVFLVSSVFVFLKGILAFRRGIEEADSQ